MFNNKKILITVADDSSLREDVCDVLRCSDSVKAALKLKGNSVDTMFIRREDFKEPERIKEGILNRGAGCVFNLFEGFEEDSYKEVEFVRILEDIELPFTGNGSAALEICLNKHEMKYALDENGIKVPKGILVKTVDDIAVNALSFPVFVKPCCEDGSVGIDEDSLVYTPEELPDICRAKLAQFKGGLVVEEFIDGCEYLAGVLGEYPYELLSISKVDYSSCDFQVPFLNYACKWDKNSRQYRNIVPKIGKIDDGLRRRIEKTVVKAGIVLGCGSYFRVDMRQKNGNIYVLDVNPNPDINRDSGFAKQAIAKGYAYEDVIESIVEEAAYARQNLV